MSSSSSSDSDSSSEDEAVLRALQSVAVSAEQLSAEQQVLAKKTKQRQSRQYASGGASGSQQELSSGGGDNALPAALDLVQLKIAALLDQRLSLMLESALEPEKKQKKKRQKQDQQAAENIDAAAASAAAMEEDDMTGLRFFKRVPTGVPVRFPKAPEVVAPVAQERQPGVHAHERILAGTRYQAASKGEADSCLPALACEADEVMHAAAARLKQLKQKPKPAAVPAAVKQSPTADPAASEKGGQEDEKKKKKRKKKQKQEGVVIVETTPFVPHNERMVALLGH